MAEILKQRAGTKTDLSGERLQAKKQKQTVTLDKATSKERYYLSRSSLFFALAMAMVTIGSNSSLFWGYSLVMMVLGLVLLLMFYGNFLTFSDYLVKRRNLEHKKTNNWSMIRELFGKE